MTISKAKKYRAFISHGCEDAEFALRLHGWLEAFRVPQIDPSSGEVQEPAPRLGVFFIDREELAAGADLNEELKAAIDASEYFILVCSHFSSRSSWVGKEIDHFLTSRTTKEILGILTPGTACLRQHIHPKAFAPFELEGEALASIGRLFANPDSDGESNAFLRLAAGLLGLGYAKLKNRHAKREQRERTASRRLAAKVHTLPAQQAFEAGNAELALKHALGYVLDGDDPGWSEASELESRVADYLWAISDLSLIRHQTRQTSSLIFSEVVLTDCRRYVITGTKRGNISVWDSETGEFVAAVERREAWRPVPRDYREADPGARSWHRPVLKTAHSPDRRTLVIAHGDYTATLWLTEEWRQIGFVEGGSFVTDIIVFSKDASKVAITCRASDTTGSFSHTIQIFNCHSGQRIGSSALRSWNLADLSFSPNGAEVVAASRDGSITRLDAMTGDVIAVQTFGADRSASAASFSPDGERLVFSNLESRPLLWKRDQNGTWRGPVALPLGARKNPNSRCRAGAICSRDWTRACVTGHNFNVHLCELDSRRPIRALARDLHNFEFSPNGGLLAAEFERRAVRLIDGRTGEDIVLLENSECRTLLPFHPEHDPGASRAFSSDDALIAVEVTKVRQLPLLQTDLPELLSGEPNTPNSIRIYDTRNGSVVDDIAIPGTAIKLVGFSASNKRIWFLASDTDLRVRELRMTRELGHANIEADGEDGARRLTDKLIAISKDGKYLAVAEKMRRVRLFDPLSCADLGSIEVSNTEIANFDFGRDGDVLVVTCNDGVVKLFDCATGEQTADFEDHPEGTLVDLLEVSPDGARIATATAEDARGPIVVRELSANAAPVSLAAEPPYEVRKIAFSPDSRKVVFTDITGEVLLWDIAGKREEARGDPGLPHRGLGVGMTWDGKWIAGADAFGHVNVFSAETGAMLPGFDLKFQAPMAGLEEVKLSTDGICLVAADFGNLQLMRLDSMRQFVLGSRNETPLPPFVISPGGRLLATNSVDNTVRLWRMSDGQSAGSLKGHAAPIVGLVFSSSEEILATVDYDGHVRTWDVRTALLTGGDLTAWVCDRLKGELSVPYGLEIANIVLRDFVHPDTGFGLNLVEEVFARWPELKDRPILSLLQEPPRTGL